MPNEQAIDVLLTISEASQEAATVALLIDRIRRVLREQWFRSEENMGKLIEAIEKGNSEEAIEIIEDKENSEEIFQTIEEIYLDWDGQKTLSDIDTN